MTCVKNNPDPTTVNANQFPRVGLRSNFEQSPRSKPTPEQAVTNANRPVRQSVTGNPIQK